MPGSILLQHAPPAPALARWVHSYRHYLFAGGAEGTFTSLPGTGAELWLLESGTLCRDCAPVGSGLLCLRSRRIDFLHAGLQIFAIRFRAGGLPFFTDRALAELVDGYTPLKSLIGDRFANQFSGRQGSTDFAEKCHWADRQLSACLRENRQLEATQQLATRMYENSADFALTKHAEVLQRDRSVLSREFRRIQGISAKHFHRLCRFERFLRDALFTAEPSLAGLAIDHGYFDQAHLTREVRAFSQKSPRLLLEGAQARLFYSWRSAEAHERPHYK